MITILLGACQKLSSTFFRGCRILESDPRYHVPCGTFPISDKVIRAITVTAHGTAGANPFGDPRLIHFVTISVFVKPPLEDF